MTNLKSKKRLLLIKVIIIGVSFIVSLIILEVSLRIIDWYNNNYENSSVSKWRSTYEFSESRHHRLIPNIKSRHNSLEFDYLWENNSLGMRDKERTRNKSANNFRILFLGDSMVQGWGVPLEKSMVSLLENKLNDPRKEKYIEVINAGIFGYSPFLECIYLKELIQEIDFDMVIIGFLLSNDIGDDYFYAQQAKLSDSDSAFYFDDNDKWPWTKIDELSESEFTFSDSSFTSQAWGFIKTTIEPVLKKSRLYRFVKENLDKNSEKENILRRNEIMTKIVKDNRNDITLNLGLINYPVLTEEQRLNYWEISFKYLTEIFNLCKRKNIPAVLVVIPGENPDFNEPYKIIDNFVSKLSFPVIYLKQGFMNYTKPTNYPLDGHWNVEGNRLAATIINDELRNLILLPFN